MNKNSSHKNLFLVIIIMSLVNITMFSQEDLLEEALSSIERGTDFFYSLNVNGGYAHNYNLDLSTRWGEDILEDSEIEVEPPGTPSVGEAYLRAFNVTGNKKFLEYAETAGLALVKGQNSYGGWDHTIDYNRMQKHEVVSLDDNHTQSAISFLIKLSGVSDNNEIHEGLKKALDLMLECQFESGAWPHLYPKQGNYHDYATFNDGGINNCINLMMEAYSATKDKRYLKSIKMAGHYIYVSQYHPPQTGWAQQYNEFLQPAWARTFEPASLSALVTIRNIYSLMDIFLLTNDETLLEPIPDAFIWLESIKLPNGKYPRFVELGTNKALYYDRGRKRVNSVEELSVERRRKYGYEQKLDSMIVPAQRIYESILAGTKYTSTDEYFKREIDPSELEDLVKNIIESQDEYGRWLNKNDVYRKIKKGEMWDGNFATEDRISSGTFIRNIWILSEYIKNNTNNE